MSGENEDCIVESPNVALLPGAGEINSGLVKNLVIWPCYAINFRYFWYPLYLIVSVLAKIVGVGKIFGTLAYP